MTPVPEASLPDVENEGPSVALRRVNCDSRSAALVGWSAQPPTVIRMPALARATKPRSVRNIIPPGVGKGKGPAGRFRQSCGGHGHRIHGGALPVNIV